MQTGIRHTTLGAQAGEGTRLLRHWLTALKARASSADAAQTRLCALNALPPDLMRDTGRTPEDATGVPRHQPDLPFFLQSGFGRR